MTSRMLSAPAISIDQAVQTEGDAAVRRRAELQRIEQEAELALRLFGVDAEQLEHRRLHVRRDGYAPSRRRSREPFSTMS